MKRLLPVIAYCAPLVATTLMYWHAVQLIPPVKAVAFERLSPSGEKEYWLVYSELTSKGWRVHEINVRGSPSYTEHSYFYDDKVVSPLAPEPGK